MALALPVAEKERRDCLAKLESWREHLAECKDGTANCVLTIGEIRLAIDIQLDRLSELRGR